VNSHDSTLSGPAVARVCGLENSAGEVFRPGELRPVAGGQVHGLDLADPRQLPHRCEPLLDPLPAASARARDAPLAQAPARPSPTTSHGGLWPRELEKDYVLEESGCYRPIYLGTDR